MFSMKDVCAQTGLTYETLKFYCNEGLVPNVKRDAANRRVFDEYDVAWIKGLQCLKNCSMGLREMKTYTDLCLQGEASILQRKLILAQKREELLAHIAQIQASLDYIDRKQAFYDGVLSGEIPYTSNLIRPK